MTHEQERALKASEDLANQKNLQRADVEKQADAKNEEVFVKRNEPVLQVEPPTEEVTNNDGSIIETLDTAFHNEPGYIKDHSIAGSNRADYYEARSQGESDVEEEQDYLKKQQQ